jgi:hypothetical protein
MPAQLLARLDATPGDPWRDAALAQRPPAARLVRLARDEVHDQIKF